MIHKDDRIISMLLLNSHESDMTYQRPDTTTYICQIRKNKPDTFRIPETQLSLPINLPSTSKPFIPNPNAPHVNMLEKHYGKEWKPIPQEGLEPHYS